MVIKFYELMLSTESWWSKESNEIKIKKFELKAQREICVSKSGKLSLPNLGEMKNNSIS